MGAMSERNRIRLFRWNFTTFKARIKSKATRRAIRAHIYA